jgi:hypothetical protein
LPVPLARRVRPCAEEATMAKAGQHHNAGVNSAKPRGHEVSRGRNHPDRTTEGAAWNNDIRDDPTNTGSTRARGAFRRRRSGSDSNADSGTRGH